MSVLPSKRAHDGHDAALDGLRGVAVLLVVLHHWIAPHLRVIDLGLTGVRLFFALSGFLITRVLLDARAAIEAGESSLGRALRSFYARRALRIFPLYYAALAGLWLVDAPGVRDEIFWHLGYMTSLLVARYDQWIGLPSHFWSLSVEEQFYLFWPWLVLLAPARRLRVVIACVFLIGPLWRTVGLIENVGRFALLHTLPGCLDALGAGALLALARDVQVRARTAAVMLAAGVALLALVAVTARVDVAPWLPRLMSAQRGGAWSLALASMVGFGAQTEAPLARVLSLAPLAYVGRLSYAVYVIHPMVPMAVRSLGLEPAARSLQLALWSALTLSFAALSWRFFEGPINAYKSRFPYRSTRADVA